ncbi:MAG TPA: metal ABC transporter substrate-binding protein [Bacilli bacterium]|nr:metal ABC transporter substrate-binding protein [Bacilli bacterium]
MFKKRLFMFAVAIMAMMLLVACGGKSETDGGEKETSDAKLKVVATFSILHDIANEVGGERVEVHSMVPIGNDPHEYEPLPEDIKKATDADVLFYNGLNLEGGDTGWFAKLVKTVGQDESKVFELMKGVEPRYLSSEDGREEEINPHAFLDPIVGMKMVENARDAFIQVDPQHKELYEENAAKYLAELEEIHKEYETKIAEIPEEKRVLVTSEKAFQYMTARYGLKEGYIWEIDTEEQGSPEQIKRLIEFVKENDVPVLFVESNVDKRPMETVSKETGIEIFAEVFSDELGESGQEGETYTKFLRYNIETIHAGLTK